MTVIGISMAKDEADVVEVVQRHMASQVDRLIVADNMSSDGTREVLDRLASELPLTVVDDPEVGYTQSAKMSRLAETARTMGATWIVPYDQDEIWIGRAGSVKETLAYVPKYVQVAEAPLYDYVATGRDNGAPSPIEAMRWRRPSATPLSKVAVRASEGLVIHQGNHGVTVPDQPLPPIIKHLLTVRHFPYRSADQMIRKARNGAAAYEATDLPEEVGQHWRGYGRMSDEQIIETFYRWYYRDDPAVEVVIEGEAQPALIEDPAWLGG